MSDQEFTDEQRKQKAEAAAQAREERRKAREARLKAEADSADGTEEDEQRIQKAEAAAQAREERRKAREARLKAEADSADGTEEDEQRKQKAEAAAQAREERRKAREARQAAQGSSNTDLTDDEKAQKREAAAKAREERRRAREARENEDEIEEESKPASPNQPLLDQVLQILQITGEEAVEESYINEADRHLPYFIISSDKWLQNAKVLKENDIMKFQFLRNVSGVDHETHMEVVYHLLSLHTGKDICVKVRTDRDQPSVPSVTPVWQTANWPEREIYDLLGIDFPGHPDLRRIMMPDEWIGHPLRKDYEPFDPEV